MNKKEYFDKVDKIVRDAIAEMNITAAEIQEVEEKIKDHATYNREYIEKTLYPQRDTLRAVMARYASEAKEQITKLSAKYAGELRSANDIRGEDITEDVRLFGIGVTLSQRDLEKMFDRNAGNATMERLICEYAAQHNVKISRVYTPHNQETITAVENMPSHTGYVLKYYNMPSFYNEFMGEGSSVRARFTEVNDA